MTTATLYQDCPAQPCHRDGRYGLSVIIPLTNDYVIYVYPWSSASDYALAGRAMKTHVKKTATDNVRGHPVKIVANPGDVIISTSGLGISADRRAAGLSSCGAVTIIPGSRQTRLGRLRTPRGISTSMTADRRNPC